MGVTATPNRFQVQDAALDRLQQLAGKDAKRAIYSENGVLKTSKFPLGRTIMAKFSADVRAQHKAAVTQLEQTMQAHYGKGLDLQGPNKERMSVADLQRAVRNAAANNKMSMDANIKGLETAYGRAGKDVAAQIKASNAYTLGLDDGKVKQKAAPAAHAVGKQYMDVGVKLRTTDMPGRDIIKELSTIPSIKTLYEGSAQVSEGYTVGQHTGMVFDQFDSQKGFYHLDRVEAQLHKLPGFENTNAERFMKTVIALHDIGKSLGASAAEQHHYTIPILRETMQQMGFTPQEIKLAIALVDQDILGEMQKSGGKKIGVQAAAQQVRKLADDAGVPPLAFLRMQKLFYISDSSSYPGVRSQFMHDPGGTGKLAFKKDKGAEVTAEYLTKAGFTEADESKIDDTGAVPPSLNTALPDVKRQVVDQFLSAIINDRTSDAAVPTKLFKSLLYADKNITAFDVADRLKANEAALRGKIALLPPETRAVAQARLAHGLQMADFCKTLQKDGWTADYAREVAHGRLLIRDGGVLEDVSGALAVADSSAMFNGKPTDANGVTFGGLRGTGGASEKFYNLMRANGGSPELIESWGYHQAADSWIPTSQAVKWFFCEAQGGKTGDFWFKDGAPKARENFVRLAGLNQQFWTDRSAVLADPAKFNDLPNTRLKSGMEILDHVDPKYKAADKSLFKNTFHLWAAMQMEVLDAVDLPGRDPVNKTVTVYRTENDAVMTMNNLKPGDQDKTLKRGVAESGSLFAPLSAYGKELTTQQVPYHRILGNFMLAMPNHPDKGAFHADMQREVLFNGAGIPFDYAATKWDYQVKV